LFFSTQCSSAIRDSSEIDIFAEESVSSNQADKGELLEGESIKLLTQNTMLIPFNFVAPAFNERTNCIIDLILKDYGIVCLQEVYSGNSQNRIISSWNDMISWNVNHGGFSQWQIDYFDNWYSALPDKDKDIWHPLSEAQSIKMLSDNKNFWGVKVLDTRVNNVEAKLICNPYYVMGPDRGRVNIRQDGGLVILSKYPIIECSAMTYLLRNGSDRLANKGVVYARIQVGLSKNDYIHVFDTHIQSYSYSKTRLAQVSELINFIYEVINELKTIVLATGKTEHACVNSKGRPIPIPEWLKQICTPSPS
jgi:hypothetical protein